MDSHTNTSPISHTHTHTHTYTHTRTHATRAYLHYKQAPPHTKLFVLPLTPIAHKLPRTPHTQTHTYTMCALTHTTHTMAEFSTDQ